MTCTQCKNSTRAGDVGVPDFEASGVGVSKITSTDAMMKKIRHMCVLFIVKYFFDYFWENIFCTYLHVFSTCRAYFHANVFRIFTQIKNGFNE